MGLTFGKPNQLLKHLTLNHALNTVGNGKKSEAVEVLTCGLRQVPMLSKYVLVISGWHGSFKSVAYHL